MRKQLWIEHLKTIYGDPALARETADRMETAFSSFHGIRPRENRLTEKDAILITYGDTLTAPGRKGIPVRGCAFGAHLRRHNQQ